MSSMNFDIIKAVKWYKSHYRMPCPEFTRFVMKTTTRGHEREREINRMIDNEIDRFYGIKKEYIQQELFA